MQSINGCDMKRSLEMKLIIKVNNEAAKPIIMDWHFRINNKFKLKLKLTKKLKKI